MRRTSAWDLLRNVAMLSREQSSLAADLLSRLDTALHTERYTQRPAYGLALNAFKLQLLAGVKDATAQAVCMVWPPAIKPSTLECRVEMLLCAYALTHCKSPGLCHGC